MNKDWYPASRDGQLHMAKTWKNVLTGSATAWGIPAARVTALTQDIAAAQNALDLVTGSDRSHTTVVACNEVFKDLETEMRFIKKHYLFIPPLSPTDYAALLLPLPDSTPTTIAPPTGQPQLSITYPGGPHLLMVHFAPLTGTLPPDTRGDYGYALYRGVMPPGGATLEQAASVKHYLMSAPVSGEGLLYSRFTRRKKETEIFAAEESGMTVYFCARYENQKGEAGPWGPVASAVIP